MTGRGKEAVALSSAHPELVEGCPPRLPVVRQAHHERVQDVDHERARRVDHERFDRLTTVRVQQVDHELYSILRLPALEE